MAVHREFSGERLRELRKQARLNRTLLAFAVGRTVDSIGNYERGITVPSAEVLATLAGYSTATWTISTSWRSRAVPDPRVEVVETTWTPGLPEDHARRLYALLFGELPGAPAGDASLTCDAGRPQQPTDGGRDERANDRRSEAG